MGLMCCSSVAEPTSTELPKPRLPPHVRLSASSPSFSPVRLLGCNLYAQTLTLARFSHPPRNASKLLAPRPMGRRKERRLAAMAAAGRRVKLDLFLDPSPGKLRPPPGPFGSIWSRSTVGCVPPSFDMV